MWSFDMIIDDLPDGLKGPGVHQWLDWVSRRLTYILRHQAKKYRLDPNGAGSVRIDRLLQRKVLKKQSVDV